MNKKYILLGVSLLVFAAGGRLVNNSILMNNSVTDSSHVTLENAAEILTAKLENKGEISSVDLKILIKASEYHIKSMNPGIDTSSITPPSEISENAIVTASSINEAFDYLDELHTKVITANPPVIPTGANECFIRMPYVADVSLMNNSQEEAKIVLIGNHASIDSFNINEPDEDITNNTLAEMNLMDDLAEHYSVKYNTDNVIVLGDFNAAGNYMSESEYNSSDLMQPANGFSELISFSTDTKSNSDNSLDKIFFKGTSISVPTNTEVRNYVTDPDDNETVREDNAGQTLTSDPSNSYWWDADSGETAGSNPTWFSYWNSGSNKYSMISDHYLVSTTLSVNGQGYKVAAFNLQNFGQAKGGIIEFTSAVKSMLADYDIILLQEVQNSDQSELTDDLNALAPTGYLWVKSDRVGSYDAGQQVTLYSNALEQYVYMYNPNKIQINQAESASDGGARICERSSNQDSGKGN